ncbi:heme-binding protein [Gammaproteobacteria bacterium]|nr:heme-binding protein [Gammaproteobacteria bacterium]
MKPACILPFIFLLILSSYRASAEDEALFTTRSLTPQTALTAATAALENCRSAGYQVAVAVVDRMGVLQVLIRDRFAGAHTPETARRKAWTSVSFRTNTSEMVELTAAGNPQAGIRHLDNVAIIGGGVIIEAAGSLVGAIGISGAPGGDRDEDCAIAGIEAIEDSISF